MALHNLPAQLADQALPVLEKGLAPLNAFANEWTTDNRRSVSITEFTALYATQTNPSSYTGGEDTSAGKTVTVNEYSEQVRLNSQEALLGHTISPRRIRQHAQQFAEKLWDVVADQITAATFTTTPINTGAESSFDTADIETAYANLADGGDRFLLLSPASFAAVMLPSSNDTFVAGGALYGFNGVYEVNKWDASSLQANTHGIACTPLAFAVASGIPSYSNGVNETLEEEIVEVPKLGISCAFRHTIDPGSRTESATMDILFGAEPGVEEALTIIRTAA